MDKTRIPLKGATGVAEASTLYGSIQEAIAAGQSLVFDMSEATDVDASILQLILAARISAANQGLEVTVQDASADMAESLERHGAGEGLTPCMSPEPVAADTEN